MAVGSPCDSHSAIAWSCGLTDAAAPPAPGGGGAAVRRAWGDRGGRGPPRRRAPPRLSAQDPQRATQLVPCGGPDATVLGGHAIQKDVPAGIRPLPLCLVVQVQISPLKREPFVLMCRTRLRCRSSQDRARRA